MPAAFALHAIPDLLDAMAMAGFTLPMAAAALRAAIAADKGSDHVDRENQRPALPAAPATDATRCNADATRRPLSSTERSRIFRAKQRTSGLQRAAVAGNVAVAPPLSPIEILPKKEARNAATISTGAHPLPEEWQPSPARLATAVQRLGEVGARNLTAKFRHHFHARANDMRSAAAWQARFTSWSINERGATAEPQLPLLRKMPDHSAPDDKWEAMKRRVRDPGYRDTG